MSPWIATISKTLTNEKPSRRHALQAIGGFRCLLVVLVSLLALGCQSGHPHPAVAATQMSYTFTVNTTLDTHDAHPGDGKCADKMGQCSLRAAIEESDALPSGSRITITVPAGTYGLTLGTLALTTNTITINGAGNTTTLIKGNHTFGIMSISATGSATLSQLTLEGGKAQHGGGIVNSGMLSLSSTTVSGNIATYGGGGIWNDYGTLSLSNTSRVSGNKATYGGGGIKNDGGTVTVSNSTVSRNTAGENGGGIFNGYSSGTVSVIKSTVSGNTAGSDDLGGGIFNGPGTVSVSQSIVNNNSAYTGGGISNGGYQVSGGTATVTSSTISGNSYCGIFSNSGTLSVSNSTFSGNSAPNGSGGGLIIWSGTASVSSSTFDKNTASNFGGGIANQGTLSVSSSTVSGNGAYDGGGIGNFGTLSVSNSTISNNGAGNFGGEGGGIYNYYYGSVSVSNSTISGNSTYNHSPGGGIYNDSGGSVTLTGTIVANSSGGGGNCAGTIKETAGYNLDSGTSCGFSRRTDLNKTNPKLGPLHDNGGPTETMALQKGSKAIDWVALSSYPSTDQRGHTRPDGSGESSCDIGAYESAY